MADLADALGVPLLEWQEVALEAALGERSDGRWASKFIGISAPRQNGKSQLIMARVLAGVLLFGEESIIVSAHETDTAREIWRRILDVIEANPSLESRVVARMDAINRESLTFDINGRRCIVKLKARGNSGSRGFSCDCLLLDEGQILGKSAWGSIVPTVSARPNPQIWLFGTPPTESDDPFAFSRVRDSAKSGKARHAWLEWAASTDDDFDEPATWAKANPAFGSLLTEEACADDRAAMDDEQFGRERLGIWDDLSARNGVIPMGLLAECEDPESQPVDRFALGVEVGPDLKWATICLAGQRADGLWHFNVEDDQFTRGTRAEWVEKRVKHLVDNNPQIRSVAVDVAGPVSALLEQYVPGRWRFKESRVPVDAIAVKELGAETAKFLSDVAMGAQRLTPSTAVTAAAQVAGKRALGDTGMWVFSRQSATSDITQIQAAVLALWAARKTKARPPRRNVREGSRQYVTRSREGRPA